MAERSELVVEIALVDAADLASALRAGVPAGAQVSVYSDYRDFSVVEVVCSAAAAGVVGLVLDVLKDFVKQRVLPAPGGPPQAREVSVRIGQVTVHLDAGSPPAEVDATLDRLARLVEAGDDEAGEVEAGELDGEPGGAAADAADRGDG